MESIRGKVDPYKDLGLNPIIRPNDELWTWLGTHLHSLANHPSPSTKMQCIYEVMQLLSHHLQGFLKWNTLVEKSDFRKLKLSYGASGPGRKGNNSKGKEGGESTKGGKGKGKEVKKGKSERMVIGADDLFPALLWVIIKNEPKRLASSLALIERVSDPPSTGIHAFAYTLFQQAVHYIPRMASKMNE